MPTLTIRNLSLTPLQLTVVERFAVDPSAGAAGAPPAKSGITSSVTGFFWGLLRAPMSLVSGFNSCANGGRGCSSGGGGGTDGGGVDLDDVVEEGTARLTNPLARDEIAGVTIGPFETHTTGIRPADPAREVLRLTFAAVANDDDDDDDTKVVRPAPPPATYHRDHRNRRSRQSNENGYVGRRRAGRCYTVDLPATVPNNIQLQAVEEDDDDNMTEGGGPSFSAVYAAETAHLAVMGSSAPLSSWMARVEGGWPLSCLSLPGTHNSPACYFSLPSVRCQGVSVRTQLEHGVRFLDVRVSVSAGGAGTPHADPPRLVLVHSAFPVSLTATHYFADDVYRPLCDFLDAHPSETVLLSIKREGTGRGSDGDLAHQLLRGYVDRPGQPRSPRWFTEPRIPTLDEARGRIVLVRRFCLPVPAGGGESNSTYAAPFDHIHGGAGWGLDGSDWPDNCAEGSAGGGLLRLQDFYGVMKTGSIDKKITYACAHLARCACQAFSTADGIAAAAVSATGVVAAVAVMPQRRSSRGSRGSRASKTQPLPPPPPPLFINFLSGSNFFNSSCWPESIAARVNPAIVEHLCTRHGTKADAESTGLDDSDDVDDLYGGNASTGIVVTDWVGYDGDWDLMRCIVAWNARLWLRR